MAVASGVHDVVLVIGVEKMRDKSTEEGLLSRAAAGHPIFTRGETAPVLFAPFATRHMHEFGTTREMLASVAVKNHYNGALDPYAHFQNEITIDARARRARRSARRCTCSTAARRPTAPPRCSSSPRTGRTSSPTTRCTSPGSASRPTTRTCTRRRASSASTRPSWPSQRGLRDGRRRARRDIDMRRGARLLHDHRDPRHRGPRLRRQGQGRRRVARGRDVAHRPHPGEHVRRAARQGPPDRRDRRRADHRVLVAAARRGRRAPGRDPQRVRAPAQRRRPGLRRRAS